MGHPVEQAGRLVRANAGTGHPLVVMAGESERSGYFLPNPNSLDRESR